LDGRADGRDPDESGSIINCSFLIDVDHFRDGFAEDVLYRYMKAYDAQA